MSKRKKFPRGKCRPDDQGELRIAVVVENSTVILHFGKPVIWLGLDAHMARVIGQRLIELASKIES